MLDLAYDQTLVNILLWILAGSYPLGLLIGFLIG